MKVEMLGTQKSAMPLSSSNFNFFPLDFMIDDNAWA